MEDAVIGTVFVVCHRFRDNGDGMRNLRDLGHIHTKPELSPSINFFPHLKKYV